MPAAQTGTGTRNLATTGRIAAAVALLASLLTLSVAAPASAVVPPAGSACTLSEVQVAGAPSAAINDLATTSDTLALGGAGAYLWDVDLTTNITHTYAADLEVVLKSPAGTEVTITTDNGGGNDDVFAGTLWDDDAGTPVTDATYTNNVAATPLVPEEAMAAFIGEDPNGTWTLEVFDDSNLDTGTLNSWSLAIATLPSPPKRSVLSAAGTAGLAVTDNTTVSDTVAVGPAPGPIAEIQLFTGITHTYAADLEVVLKSPAGTEVTITTDNGGGNDDVFAGTDWFDGAGTPVTDATYTNNVAATPLVPEEAMGAFIGEDPAGTWTLEITDDAGGDVGSLDFWTLTAVVHRCDVPASSGQVLYGIANDNAAAAGNATLYALDTTTGAATMVGPTGTTSIGAIDMDPTTGRLYGNVSATNTLVEINPATGAATVVGLLGLAAGGAGNAVTDFAFDLNGNLFGHRWGDDTLAAINKATGAATPIGNPGFAPAVGLEYDPVAGVMRMFRRGGAGTAGSWAVVNPSTASTLGGPTLWRAENGHRKSLAIDRNGKGYSTGWGPSPGSYELLWADPLGGGTWAIGPTGIANGSPGGLGPLAIQKGPPVAIPDNYSVGAGSTLVVNGVLDNDTDVDSNLSAVLVSGPANGSLALNANGSFTYTPRVGFVGTDSFVYGASDGVTTTPATATITVNAGPVHDVGLVDPTSGIWYLRRASTGAVTPITFGNPGDVPFVGDWDCDGVETPGLYRQSDGFAYLRNSNTTGIADVEFFFGNPGDVPIAGDFNGDGCDTVSIYRPSQGRFFIINKLGSRATGLGAAETDYLFGNPGDKPFVGDFDGDGVETVGLHRESTGLVYFRNSHTTGIAESQFIFGDPGDRFIGGDWNGNGLYSPAMFRPATATVYQRFTNTQGIADTQFGFGEAPWLPVAGVMGLG